MDGRHAGIPLGFLCAGVQPFLKRWCGFLHLSRWWLDSIGRGLALSLSPEGTEETESLEHNEGITKVWLPTPIDNGSSKLNLNTQPAAVFAKGQGKRIVTIIGSVLNCNGRGDMDVYTTSKYLDVCQSMKTIVHASWSIRERLMYNSMSGEGGE
ncbi:uncharacterized protein LOC124649199 [Lolium rigidum]|uniref:uncharacterized protein LOC124649199 n=1 Tax=Lolium rigidum TaxID=89674 RepID=UPI001F5CC878|nr:uncharacterized protein LOC124649199 [Lolium rigidum]